MGNFPTEKTPQELLNFWTDYNVNPPTLVVGLAAWNGTGYERILSVNNALKVAGMTLKKLNATGQVAGSLNLTDINWAISKAWLKRLTLTITAGASTDFDIEIYEKDTFLAANKIFSLDANDGNVDIILDCLFEDIDATNELHIKVVDNDGTNPITFNLEIRGIELL
jgi:hypothetical protein